MITCFACGAENIPGAEICDACHQPLVSGDLEPASSTEQALLKDRIEALPPRPPLITSPETTVGDVLQLMVQNKAGCVIVAEDDQAVGIFSERDALHKINIEAEALKGRPIREFMTPSPETLQARNKIVYAIHRMDLGGYRHIPIVENGKPVGIISIRDILDYLTEHIPADQPA